MILGNICTRACRFCNASRGMPKPQDQEEPARIGAVVKERALKYVVLTSPTRDDLLDGGAEHFRITVEKIREMSSDTLVEVLAPDFNGCRESLRKVVNSGIVVFSHNIEVVKRFYGYIRDGNYRRSLWLIREAKEINPEIITKSGFLVGFGETLSEIEETLLNLREVDCDIVTVGQYLQPSKKALPVVEYKRPEVFEWVAKTAEEMGFRVVCSAPLVRSSTLAPELYTKAKEARDGKL